MVDIAHHLEEKKKQMLTTIVADISIDGRTFVLTPREILIAKLAWFTGVGDGRTLSNIIHDEAEKRAKEIAELNKSV